MNIAYIGYQVQEKYTQGVSNDEDMELLLFLRGKGLTVTAVIWDDEKVCWEDYQLVLIKSPWDYHEKIEAFYRWIEKMQALGIRMLNPSETVQWNSNKRYLQDILDAGLSVIPSVFLAKGSIVANNDALFRELNCDKIVVKPCISAGAKNTIVVNKTTIADQAEKISQLLQVEEYIAQPFVEEISEGEWSFLFFNGQYSHCVLKVPKQGDFRVQHNHGGSIIYPDADAKYIQQAGQYVQKFAAGTLYARVDGVIKNDTLFLMELELIEPYLFLDGKTQRLENYYQALLQLIS